MLYLKVCIILLKFLSTVESTLTFFRTSLTSSLPESMVICKRMSANISGSTGLERDSIVLEREYAILLLGSKKITEDNSIRIKEDCCREMIKEDCEGGMRGGVGREKWERRRREVGLGGGEPGGWDLYTGARVTPVKS